MQVILNNKRVYHDYFVEETIEAGIELIGCEVKSLRAGAASWSDSYAEVKDGQMYLKNLYIKEYAAGSYNNAADTKRTRRLLLHKSQIKKLYAKVREKGYTLAPTKLYLKDGLIKVEIGLCKGKHTYDKKAALKEKELKREAERIKEGFQS